jgi:ABC-type sugar transport system substrate-binding protein
LTIGAIQALQEKNIKGVHIFSINAIMEIIPFVIDGTVDVTVAVAAGVHPAVEIAWEALNGNKTFKQRYTIPGISINKANAQKYYDEKKYIVAMSEPAKDNPLMTNLFTVYPELAKLQIR